MTHIPSSGNSAPEQHRNTRADTCTSRARCSAGVRILAAALLLAGCDITIESGPKKDRIDLDRVKVAIWTDPDSGCRYVMMGYNIPYNNGVLAIAPKLRPDGTPDCQERRG